MKRVFGSLVLAAFLTACEKPMPAGEGSPGVAQEQIVDIKPDIRPVPPLGPEGKIYQDALLELMETDGYIGAAIAIVDGDREAFMFHGLADPSTGSNIHMESLFEIGSITKTFTSIILADMVLKGEVRLDDPAADYLPDGFRLASFEDQPITLKHLATHMSGMPRLPFNLFPKDFNNPYADYGEDSLKAFLDVYNPIRAPGEKLEYSNLATGLLGIILAHQANMSFEALVRDRILDPLEMDNTYIQIPESKLSVFAQGHNFKETPVGYWDIPTLAGAGALRSDIADMSRYLKANLGLVETPLSDAIALSHNLQYDLDENGNYIGLGWFTYNLGDRKMTWHNGGTGGFSTFLGFDAENKRGAVVLLNSAVDADIIGRAIITKTPDLMRPKKDSED